MKWHIENESLGFQTCSKLKESISKGTFSSIVLETALRYANTDVNVTLRSDNLSYIEHLVTQIIGLCYVKNFKFDMVTEDHDTIYKSNRLKSNHPKDSDCWYMALSKIGFVKDGGTSYHFHLSKRKKNFHLILIHDKNII